jgi:hypothetical protein
MIDEIIEILYDDCEIPKEIIKIILSLNEFEKCKQCRRQDFPENLTLATLCFSCGDYNYVCSKCIEFPRSPVYPCICYAR